MSLRDDLARGAEEVRETHVSGVFLTRDEVFKVKKPVSLGFLDFRSIEQRKAACEAEVQLNARLAPDVYRGVVPVVLEGGVHRLGGEGEIVDWAVHMRRLRDEDRADHLLASGALDAMAIDRAAITIARFHEGARHDEETGRFGWREAIAVNVQENFEQTRETIGALVSEEEAARIEEGQLAFLERAKELFEERVRRGRVRDGHGDLRLEHVYLEGERIVIIDCIEFNERFRYADVCADLAFLSMDLAWHGRVDLSERLLATYARETNDFDLYPLVDFYESYRAYVRGKVSAMLAADEGAPLEVREKARAEARRYFLLALAAERPPILAPMVVAIGGNLATGKSTLADRLGLLLGAPSINTDRVRKHMIGARATDKLYEGTWSGAYDPAFTERVYAEVGRAAASVIASGRPVILDASFRSTGMRADARALATALDVPFVFVECRADPDVCRARLRERAKGPSVSDGRIEIFDEFLASWQAVTELPESEHVVVHTDRPMDEVLATLRARLPMWPAGS